jgi:hypothetical protein
MDEIKDYLDRLSDLSDGEIADLEGRILSNFDKVEKEDPTRETVDAMTGLADALDAVRGETTRRTDQQKELARMATEASTRVRGATAQDASDEETTASTTDPTKDPEDEETADAADDVTEDPSADADDEETEEEKRKRAAGPVAAVPALAVEDTAPVTAPESAAEALSVDAPAAPAEPVEALAVETPPAVVVQSPEAVSEAAAATPEAASLSDSSETAEESSSLATDEDKAAAEDEPSDTLSDDNTTQKSEGAVTASATTSGQVVVTPPAGNRPVPREERTGVQLAITAGADIPGVGSGTKLADMGDVAKAFANRLHTLRNVSGGMGEQHTVATLNFEYPEDRQLGGDDSTNLSRISRITSPEVITAAAAICAPLETLYDINVCGVTDRPVRDSLARFSADRGGVRMYGTPTLGNCAGLWTTTGSWTAQGKLNIATAANAGGTAPYAGFPTMPNATATAKGCCDAVCPDPRDVILDAIYACMRFSNFTNRFFPEVVKANTDLALINHARFAEQYLLNGISAQSTKVTVTSSPVGLTRAIIRVIRQGATGIRRRHRLEVNAPMRVILPSWLLDAMVADIALQMPGDGLDSLGIAESKLRAIFSDANVNVTWAIDEVDATGQPIPIVAQAAGALQDFPTTVSFPLFPEGAFLYLDGGTLDLGVVRDTTTIAANEYATFVESFESVAFTGCESLWITLSGLCVSGAAAALVDTACA